MLARVAMPMIAVIPLRVAHGVQDARTIRLQHLGNNEPPRIGAARYRIAGAMLVYVGLSAGRVAAR
jgi:hypothetical protein